VVQFAVGRDRLSGVRTLQTTSFRHSLAVLARAALVICPEGGLHHGAAAMGAPAVVLFGGFIPPQVTGYETHANLTGGAKACGQLAPCQHCRAAMDAITVDAVIGASIELMSRRKP
jgi:ADP-heptose:LPS heptosyltransferase